MSSLPVRRHPVREASARPSFWNRVAVAGYIGLNIGMSVYSLGHGVPLAADWALWSALPEAIERGTPYMTGTALPMVWSPLMGWVMSAVVLYIGFWPWAALHLAVVGLLRDPLLIVMTIASWGFWMDLAGANTFVFVFVAGALAFAGNRPAAYAYLGLCLLMPRPVQLPLAVWLLVTKPHTRIPFFALFVVHALIVMATGYADDWLMAVVRYGSDPADIGPGHWTGLWWLAIGVPLGVLLTLRGRLGWAGVAVTPYLLPQYLLMPLIELRRRVDRDS